MTSKERVLAAINHQKTDRIPIDLGGSTCSLVDRAYFALRDYMGIRGDIEPYRKGSNVSYYDERIYDALDIDVRRVYAKQSGLYPKHHPDGTFSNEWGLVQRDTGLYVETVKNPLAEASIEDLDTYEWPETEKVLDISGMKERAKQLYEENQYAISMRMPCNGIIEIACWLRGMQNFMIDTIADPEFAHKLIDKILEKQMEMYSYMLDEVGEYVDIVESGDDYGSQKSLLMSPLYERGCRLIPNFNRHPLAEEFSAGKFPDTFHSNRFYQEYHLQQIPVLRPVLFRKPQQSHRFLR